MKLLVAEIEIKKEKLKNRDIIVKDLRIRKLKRQKKRQNKLAELVEPDDERFGTRNGV
jgi:hypothetical protein